MIFTYNVQKYCESRSNRLTDTRLDLKFLVKAKIKLQELKVELNFKLQENTKDFSKLDITELSAINKVAFLAVKFPSARLTFSLTSLTIKKNLRNVLALHHQIMS